MTKVLGSPMLTRRARKAASNLRLAKDLAAPSTAAESTRSAGDSGEDHLKFGWYIRFTTAIAMACAAAFLPGILLQFVHQFVCVYDDETEQLGIDEVCAVANNKASSPNPPPLTPRLTWIADSASNALL